MNVEQFKKIADEELGALNVDERLVNRIHQRACELERRPSIRIPRFAAFAASVCAVVMLISGGILAASRFDPAAGKNGVEIGKLEPERAMETRALSAKLETSSYIDGSTLAYGIESIGEYSEGYAPALATNGLYGYVNEEQVWVIMAIYESAGPVLDGKAVVIHQNKEQILSFS